MPKARTGGYRIVCLAGCGWANYRVLSFAPCPRCGGATGISVRVAGGQEIPAERRRENVTGCVLPSTRKQLEAFRKEVGARSFAAAVAAVLDGWAIERVKIKSEERDAAAIDPNRSRTPHGHVTGARRKRLSARAPRGTAPVKGARTASE